MGKQWKQVQTLFSWAPESLQMVTAAMKWRQLLLGRKAITYLDSMLKAKTSLCWQKHLSGFSSSHIWMGELNHKESWALKNWCFQALVLEKTFESPNIQKTKIMASGRITSWEIDGETVETVSDFILLGSKITADGDCTHEIKRHLLLGRKVMINLDSIFKSRDIACQLMSA